MILMIDNYDSFTYNLVHYFQELGAELTVIRHDEWTIEEVEAFRPSHIVISPGPGHPREAGISMGVLARLGPSIPTLGVCLGHQAMAEVFGGKVVHAPQLVHGKTSPIHHDGTGVFNGLPSPFLATRYHSLMVESHTLPEVLRVNAHTDDGVVMGMVHRHHPIHGVQFHPESILTVHGHDMLRSFLSVSVGGGHPS